MMKIEEVNEVLTIKMDNSCVILRRNEVSLVELDKKNNTVVLYMANKIIYSLKMNLSNKNNPTAEQVFAHIERWLHNLPNHLGH